jgi:hypothetical protein
VKHTVRADIKSSHGILSVDEPGDRPLANARAGAGRVELGDVTTVSAQEAVVPSSPVETATKTRSMNAWGDGRGRAAQ